MALDVTSVLNAAADLIEREGWSAPGGQTVSGFVGWPILEALVWAVDDLDVFGVLVPAADAITEHLGGQLITDWEKAPGRTQAEVAELLRAAALREVA